MRRWTFLLLIAATVGVGSLWYFQSKGCCVLEIADNVLQSSGGVTLEARFTPEQIMEANRKDLLKGEQRTFLEPAMRLSPYLLLEVKYAQKDKSSGEGLILWGMEDGEMVINTESWETTHGFEDCINVGANRTDFRVINALATRGALNHDDLQKELQVESDTLDAWLEDVREKHLIIQRGSQVSLHFQQPKLNVIPQTRIGQALVTKNFPNAMRGAKRYSSSQIKKVAGAAFGTDFAVRNEKQVYLPIYAIGVQNPDGSIFTSYWNSITGKRMKVEYEARQ